MCRCKACDEVMHEGEIIWRTDRGQWEDLCGVCRSIVDVYEIGYYAALDKHKAELAKYSVPEEPLEDGHHGSE